MEIKQFSPIGQYLLRGVERAEEAPKKDLVAEYIYELGIKSLDLFINLNTDERHDLIKKYESSKSMLEIPRYATCKA